LLLGLRLVRILIIDDDSVTLKALPVLLTNRLPDSIVDTAMDEQTALALVHDGHYDVILLDVRMPSLDGMMLLLQLRADAADTPLIVMTAHPDESVETEASQAGVYAFLPKPAFPDVVIAKVQSALHRVP
jgi:DNA-binding response OmpR family regulator